MISFHYHKLIDILFLIIGPKEVAVSPIAGNPVRRLDPYSSSFAIDAKKFVEMRPHPISLCVADEWSQAIRSVNRDPSRRLKHEDSDLFHGYPVIDPHLLQNMESCRSDMYLVCWVFVRSVWLGRLYTRRPVAFPTAQEWREFCVSIAEKLGLIDPAPPRTEPPSKRRKNRRSLSEAFDGLEITVTVIPDLYFQGCLVVKGDQIKNRNIDIDPGVRRRVLFDAWEHNFRLELVGLERAVYFRGLMDEKEIALRESRVRKLFAGEHTINPNLSPSPEDFGSGSAHASARVSCVNVLASLIYQWGGDSLCLRDLRLTGDFDKSALRKLEIRTYMIYCDTFFVYFGRAPSVPRIPFDSQYSD